MWFPAADTIAFSEGGVEALRIDSSGKVLVGKASSDFGTAGIEIDGANYRAWITRSGAEPLALNRLTNDGNLIEFCQRRLHGGEYWYYKRQLTIYIR
jgi:hypothetical protein